MSKRLFQILDEMNVNDEVNKTATLPCALEMVEAKSDKRGGLVTMGVEAEYIQKIFFGEYRPMLVLLDMKEYNRLEKQPVEDKQQEAEAKAALYEQALKDIVSPIAYLQRKAAEEGAGLDGHYAQELANSASFLQSIAIDALTPKTGEDD